MTKKIIVCFYFIITLFTLLLNEKRALSQENTETDLFQQDIEVGDSICEIASREMIIYNHNYAGKLSDYWAQEYIGSDLFREEFSDWFTKNPPPENLIAITDSPPYFSHGFLVTNLISHQNKQAVLPHLKIRNFSNTHFMAETWSHRSRSLSILSSIQPSFSFVNNSIYWKPSEYLIYKKISDRGSVIVSISGNHFPLKLSSVKRKGAENLNTIIVGSLSPSGLISNFSKEDESVSILAPSNEEILSIGVNGEKRLFSGTSGAAPLVTGSLAAFEWITNYHPTLDELKLLLKKTAIPSLMSHQKPNKNGYGIVNTYKIAHVAEKISLSCQSKDSQERVTCIQESIKRNETYQFPEFSRNDLTDTLNKHFPECVLELELGEPTGSPNVVCENKKEAIKKLRKEALLDPYNKNLWKALSCIYKKEDFLFNSIYYNITALATESPIDRDKVLSTVKEAVSARKENFLKVLEDKNLKNDKFIKEVEDNLSFELLAMFRIRASFFPDTLFSFLKEKLQFFESYEYVNSYFKEKHLAHVMRLSGLLNQKEERAFFQNKGFSKYTSTHPEVSHQDSAENHLNICDLIKFPKRGEREAPLNHGYNYPQNIRTQLIKSSTLLENEDEKWNLLKRGLEDESSDVREAAIEHFPTLEDDERKLQILNCLRDSVYHLENSDDWPSSYLLSNLYDTIARLSTSLKDEEKKENSFRELLSNEDQDSNIKPHIIGALWSLSEEARSELLRVYFNHKDPILRRAVIFSLWSLDDESKIEELLKTALNDKDFDVKTAAFLSIGSLSNDEKKIEFIDLAIENPDPKIKALSMNMIWSLEETSLIQKYFDLGFQHSDFEVRKAAIKQVPDFNKSLLQKIDLFKSGMKDSNPTVQITAIKSSLTFFRRIRRDTQLVDLGAQLVDLYKTILSTILNLLDQKYKPQGIDSIIKLEFREYFKAIGFVSSDPADLLKAALEDILRFFISFQNKDWQLSFLNFFEEELESTKFHDVIKAVYIVSALSLFSDRQYVFFKKDEDQIIQIRLIKLLDETITTEKNLGNGIIEIIDISLVLWLATTLNEVELREVLFNLLKQGLKHLESEARIEKLREILLSHFSDESFDQEKISDEAQELLVKNRQKLLDLLDQELNKQKPKNLDRLP